MALGRDGNVKLMDFGIAKRARDADADERTVGTPAYMSPEHARGAAMDGRSDIYSLGVMAYEMLTARLPFGGTRTSAPTAPVTNQPSHALLRQGVDAVPSPRATNPDVPDDLEHLVARATRTDPALRFQSAREIVDLLERARERRVDLDLVRAKSLTLVYDPAQEERVARLLVRLEGAALRLPGVKIVRGG